jgi:signal transduction histidine kinase/HAMP domain-containing protein/CheY-like chemotaxis protein
MTETTASSRVTQGNGTRLRNGTDGGKADRNADNGTIRYSEADLEPLRAMLAAFAVGDFRPRAEPPDRRAAADPGPVLTEIFELADEVGTQLAAVTSEVTQSATQVRDIAQITTAVARGDLTRKVTVEATGEMLQLKQTVNMLVDQLSAFADEVTRVAREVGTEGRLGGQAQVRGVSGVWKDLTDNVNVMANNLTGQVRNIAQVATAVANGDLSKKIDVDARGEILELKTTLNTMVDQLSAFADEVTRVAREVGTEGRLGGQAYVRGVSGVWKDLTDNVNFMAGNLTGQVRNIAQVTTAVANGDLTKKIDVDAQGEILELKTTINDMVDLLSAFADEVTRVAREVGTEGILGGQAHVRGVSGVWKDLTDNVNGMAGNLTGQVRNIAQVATTVANGDLTKKIDVNARGEILELKTTLNTMVDQLSAFASEVTRVAREVGSEGRLGGQAEVRDVSGTWKRLTESVNELASNLTTQVRAIGAVASAVAEGDLTQSVEVEARGEVAELKDNVNLMVANLRETTRANQEQDWLKTNLARIAGLMQGHRDLLELARLILGELTPLASAQYGCIYLATDAADLRSQQQEFTRIATYGFMKGGLTRFEAGEGLAGQAAVERTPILINDAPAGYLQVGSGLGQAAPVSVAVLPILFEDQVLGVLELASLTRFSDVHLAFFDQFVGTIGVAINTIMATSRTEALLSESQRLTSQLQERSVELQRQQAELRRSNAELEEKAALLAKQNSAIEVQNRQIEQARQTLEERAQQLAISSRYKSDFLANMSHELRTPLNSLLVLAKLLSENQDGNLTGQQVDFARTIHAAGSDLLQLINDILDLSKVEAGKMDVNPADLQLTALVDYVDATFRPMAEDKGLGFGIEVRPGTLDLLYVDEQRLEQILRNLLSNAVKFTSAGEVRLTIATTSEVEFDGALRHASEVLAFAVSDTGVGIAKQKLGTIFDQFSQADGTTSRRYGGTGLGLSISRDIARLLGGEIRASSKLGKGSTFTLYLPTGRAPGAVRDTSADPPEVVTLPDGAIAAPADGPGAAGDGDDPMNGARILIVDDDARSVFALTGVFERYGAEVLYAENGRAGIESLERNEDISLVLMDVMMPELDGNATMRQIRKMPQFADLPIIALTAKAMKGDREKSIKAGASDYFPKPVETDHLLQLMRHWLRRSGGPGSLRIVAQANSH